MPCGRCAERGRVIRHAVTSLHHRDVQAAGKDIGLVVRTMNEDAKAFARSLQRRIAPHGPQLDQGRR